MQKLLYFICVDKIQLGNGNYAEQIKFNINNHHQFYKPFLLLKQPFPNQNLRVKNDYEEHVEYLKILVYIKLGAVLGTWLTYGQYQFVLPTCGLV